MNVLAILLWAQATLVTVEAGPDGACPSARQVREAIQLRMPGALVSTDRGAALGALRLRLTTAPAGEPAFALSETQGRVRLYRTLQPSEGGTLSECVALAETVALIVERFLQELDSRAQRSGDAAETSGVAGGVGAPGARASGWRLSLAGLYRPTDVTPSSFGGGLRFGRALAARRPWPAMLVAIAFGWHPRRSKSIKGGTAELRRLPLELTGYLRLPGGLSSGEAQAGLAAGVDAVVIDSRVMGVEKDDVGFAPWVGPGAAYSLWLGRRAFLRVGAVAGYLLTRYFVDSSDPSPDSQRPVFDTGRYLVKLEVELGFSF